MANIITKDTIKQNESFILKWDAQPGSQGAWNPGWKQQTEADSFLERVEEQPTIMNKARFINMDAKEHDISYMRVKARLQNMTKLTGAKKGAQITKEYMEAIAETEPSFSRSVLVAEPMTAFTTTPKNFLVENVEKQSFLPHMESRLAESVGYSAESVAMYGIKQNNPTDADSMHQIDGIFKQLQDVKDNYTTAVATNPKAPMGYFNDIDISKPVIPQIHKLLTQFSIQKGNRAKAELYVSSAFEGLLFEEAEQRETVEGDKLYFDGVNLRIRGVPVVHADFLDDPQNEYGEQILLADPDSIVFGFLRNIESESTYEHWMKAYLSSVDIYFDVLLLWNMDLLAAKVVDNSNSSSGSSPTPTENETFRNLTFKITDAEETGIENATVTIGDKTATTGSQGGCSLNNIAEGEHTVTVTADNYTTKTETITVDETHTSFTIILSSN